MSGFVVCAACGARIRADRPACLRCGERLIADRRLRSTPWWTSLGLSRGAMLILASVGSLVLLGGIALVVNSGAEPLDDVVRPATPPPAAGSAATASAPKAVVASPTAREAPAYEPTAFVDSTRTGGASFATGNFESAREAYTQALARKPDDPESLNGLGQSLVRLGQVDVAILRFERAIALAPDKWTYHFNLAHAVGQLGQWDRAIDEYREAARLFPTDYATQYNLAMALHKKGSEEAAIPEFEKAIRLAPGEPSFHVSLGISLEKVGRAADAVREYRQYLDMAPAAPDAAALKAHIDALASPKPATASP